MTAISDETLDQIRLEAQRFPESRSALLPALHIVQNELGHISGQAMEEVGAALGISYSDIEEVVSFYTMFYEDKVGKYVLEVCKTVPCAILGADEIIEYISEKLRIQPGETTSDGLFTLLRVECLAGCHRAPAMQVNARYYENLTREKVDLLIDLMRSQVRLRRNAKREDPLAEPAEIEPD